jgi:polysaccharide biosynthesis protein PslH
MRLLVLSPTLPLPFGKTDSRWLHAILGELARRSISVRCLSCTEDDHEAVHEACTLLRSRGVELRHVPLRLLEPWPLRKLRSLRQPCSEYLRCPELRTALRDETANGYDILHVEHLFPSWATLHMDRTVTFVHHLEVVDWEDRTNLSSRERLDLYKMRRATRFLAERIPRLVAATDRLTTELSTYGRKVATPVSPVGLDLDEYPMLPVSRRPVVGLLGSMHWYPSRAAAERLITRIWPRIRERVPEAELVVGGWNSERYLGRLLPVPGARLLGEVKAPPDGFAQMSLLLYAPPKGSGMKIKVLEAMAYGVPVVSNQEGLEGLTLTSAREAISAESDADLADAAVRVLTDSSLSSAMRDSARRLVAESYSPRVLASSLLAAYAQVGLLSG